jgi:hypothetical protein
VIPCALAASNAGLQGTRLDRDVAEYGPAAGMFENSQAGATGARIDARAAQLNAQSGEYPGSDVIEDGSGHEGP